MQSQAKPKLIDHQQPIAHELAHLFACTIWLRHHEDPDAEGVADSIMEDWGYQPFDRGYDPNPLP